MSELGSATNEFRRLLDERGVKWIPVAWNPKRETFYHAANGVGFCADEYTDGVKIYTDATITPEQAVEATLGRGECKVDVLNTGDCAGYECSEYIMHCNACGHEFGHVLYNEDGDVWMSEPPNFCPNCGAKVVIE